MNAKILVTSILVLGSILLSAANDISIRKFAIKASNGKFVGAEKGNAYQMIANKERIGKSEMFYLDNTGQQYDKLIPSSNKLIICEPGTGILSASPDERNEVKLDLIQINDNFYLIFSAQGHYVSLDQQDRLILASYDPESVARFRIIFEDELEFTESGFPANQLILIICALSIIMGSVVLFNLGYGKLGLGLLVLGSFLIRIMMASLDPYLNNWDEQFHALVAKNMISNPFKPMLYSNPALGYDPLNWLENHIWLHKQPLFLWQIALSMKIFGVTEFAVRLPSMIMGTVMVLLVYRMGCLALNEMVGFIGASLVAVSNFFLELIVGAIYTDHADVAFVFYITASIWSWIEYENSRHRKWLILIGIFSGFAILVKWVIGLLVYAGWGASILVKIRKARDLLHFRPLVTALTITVVVFLPWQLFIAVNYPEESRHAFSRFSEYFTTAFEGHGGNAWFHVNHIKRLYGLQHFIVLFSLIPLYQLLKNSRFRMAFFTMIVFIYAFFSIAATKNSTYVFVVCGIIYLSIGSLVYKIFQWLHQFVAKRTFQGLTRLEWMYQSMLICALLFYTFRFGALERNHTMLNKDMYSYRAIKRVNTDAFKEIKKSYRVRNMVLFNCSNWDHISAMFYLDKVTAYDRIPDIEELTALLEKGYRIAVMDSRHLPDYIINNNQVLRIRANYLIAR